jgi:hypothetical protein
MYWKRVGLYFFQKLVQYMNMLKYWIRLVPRTEVGVEKQLSKDAAPCNSGSATLFAIVLDYRATNGKKPTFSIFLIAKYCNVLYFCETLCDVTSFCENSPKLYILGILCVKNTSPD